MDYTIESCRQSQPSICLRQSNAFMFFGTTSEAGLLREAHRKRKKQIHTPARARLVKCVMPSFLYPTDGMR
jgi:hypothetical protein